MQEVVFVFLQNSLWKQTSFITQHPIFAVSTSLFGVLCIGIVIYYLIEQPCSKYLKNKFLVGNVDKTLVGVREREREINLS